MTRSQTEPKAWIEPDRSDLCFADGCPNRWSVQRDGDKGLCSAHAWSDPHLWPRITHEQREAVTQRAFDRQHEPPPLKLSADDKRVAIAKLQALAQQAQRHQTAQPLDDVDPDAQRRREDAKREQAERVQRYAAAHGIELDLPHSIPDAIPCESEGGEIG